MFLSIVSCELIQKNNDNRGSSSAKKLDPKTVKFIENFRAQDLYISTERQSANNQAVIDPSTANITLNSGNTSAYGANKLTFVRLVSDTKVIYRISDGTHQGKYALLHYDPANSSTHGGAIILSSSFTDNDSQLSDATTISQGQGDLYGKTTP